MGRPVEFLTHDKCGSSRLQVFKQEDGSYDGFCFGCKTVVSDPYKDKPEGYTPKKQPKSDEEITNELLETMEYPIMDIPSRGLKAVALEHFGVRVGLSTVDGETIYSYHFPYKKNGQNIAFKNTLVELNEKGKKIMWTTGEFKEAELFGWEQAISSGSRRLFVTEGEFDAVALYQIIRRMQHGTQYADNVPAIISIKSGASSALGDLTALSSQIEKHFDEVVLVFDRDDQGRQAEEDVLKNFPGWYSVDLPKKDANKCLQDGNVKAVFNLCMFKAKAPKNTKLIWASSLIEAAKEEPEWGYSWPWEGLTQETKSEVVNALGAHFISVHKWKVFMAKPEEQNKHTVKLMAGKLAGRIFHDPRVPFDHEAYDKYAPMLADSLCMMNLYQSMGWEALRADIRLAAAAGVKAVMIDPVTNLTVGMTAAEANTKLQEIAVELAAMAQDLNIVIFIFCHLKAPDTGPSHERGGNVHSTQFAGSRAMMRSCNLMIGIQGNKDPDLPKEERNKRRIVILEAREFSSSGYVDLFWDENTGLFTEL
jgi:twinkle protein